MALRLNHIGEFAPAGFAAVENAAAGMKDARNDAMVRHGLSLSGLFGNAMEPGV